jgi:hypothetical protein
MIVSYDQVKETLFGKFLSCLMTSVDSQNLMALDFERLSPVCTIDGHPVNFRAAFNKFEQALRDEPWTPTTPPTPVVPSTRPLPLSALEALRSVRSDVTDAQEYVNSAEEDWPSADYLAESISDSVASAVRDQVYEAISYSCHFDSARGELDNADERLGSLISDMESSE